MRKKKKAPTSVVIGVLIGIALGYVGPSASDLFLAPPIVIESSNDITAEVSFSPDGQCINSIVSSIDGSKSEVLVQAYHLTHKSVIEALARASRRGVKVCVLLDKVMRNNEDVVGQLTHNGIFVAIDGSPKIAHNKVMIIDQKIVITGSFNFTYSAQNKNAENLIILKNSDLARTYRNNWLKRARAASKPLN